jgi:glycosyltransferase involved in cell wall biosynthesis
LYNFSIVTPCLNEERNIENFVQKVDLLFQNKYNFKLLFVDDGSTDKTWYKIEDLKKKYSFINGIKLSRNFGKENALMCGLNNIKNEDFIITIDADLQHPLDEIEKMIQLWKDGYKIINTFRTNITENNLREIGSKFFYFLIKKFTDLTNMAKTTDFILIDKEIVKKFNDIQESNKQFRILINWLGFKKINIPININTRIHGKSKYNFIKLLKLAFNNLTSFSLFPLKLIGYLGILMSILSSLIIFAAIMDKIFFSNSLNVGINSIFATIQILLTGIILCSITFLGIYISKILKNTNNRPNYIIEKII